MLEHDERELLERAREYDTLALGEIYDRYSGRIYSYILYQVKDEPLAEDLTANVFSRMLRAIRTDNGWNQSFTSWLYRIAHNMVIDHYRRNNHGQDLPLDERLLAAKENPMASVEQLMTNKDVEAAMGLLTLDQRTVIALKFFEGLTNLEVAETMNKTEGAIKSLQFRALGALKRQLEQMWGIADA